MSWIRHTFLAVLAAACCLSLLWFGLGTTSFSTSVVDLLPGKAIESTILRELADGTQGRQLTVRLYSGSGQVTEAATVSFITQLLDSGVIRAVWRTGQGGLGEAGRRLFEDRYFWLLPRWMEEYLENGSPSRPVNPEVVAEKIARDLTSYLNSPDGLALVDLIPKDPFLLMKDLDLLLPLASVESSKSQTMLWVEQTTSPFVEEGQKDVFIALEKALQEARITQADLEMEFSGVAVFASASRDRIKGEIQRLNLLGISLVLLIALICVRNFFAMIRIALVVVIALLVAATAVVLIFDSVHIISLVIGSILTGIAVDYGFHIILREKNCLPDRETRKAVIAGSLSSALGFFALLGAPLPFLRQVGVFVGFGLVAALLSAIVLGRHPSRPIQVRAWKFDLGRLPAWSALLLFLLATPGLLMLDWGSNIQDLEYPLPELKEIDQRLSTYSSPVSNLTPYLVHADNIIQARESLQELDPGDRLTHAGSILPGFADILATHVAVNQMKGFKSALTTALEEEGFYPDAFSEFFAEWQAYLELDVNQDLYTRKISAFSEALPGPLQNMVHSGEKVSWFMVLAEGSLEYGQDSNVLLLDQKKMLSREFGEYTRTMWFYSSICLLVLAGSTCAYIGIRAGLEAIFVPVFATVGAFGLIGYSSGQVGLFHLTGGTLAFCISLDYGIFAATCRRIGKELPRSITVSSLTTLAVFGILATSQIPGVRQLAVTILLVMGFTLLMIHIRLHGNKGSIRSPFELIPHGKEACMVEKILHVDETTILATCNPHAYQAMPCESLVEAMGQCAALLLAANTQRGEPRSGMLVVVQSCYPEVAEIHPGESVTASVALQSDAREGLLQFSGKCLDKDDGILIQTQFSIFIPPVNPHC